MRDECGGTVRIITGDQVADYEREAPLPEIFTLGTSVMYQAFYDDDRVLAAVRRFVDRDLEVPRLDGRARHAATTVVP
ncbi:MAG: hypothetical protein KJO75_07820 [Dactylosporangium sp.]|nr:hypothetical protein [Dactylosporangium sp.]